MNTELIKEEILENWGIFDSNEAFNSAIEAMQQYANQEKRALEKENKELKDKVIELEGVIAKLSQKVILYECNY